MQNLLVSIFCPDQSGLVAAITGRLFDLGANLGDASFAMLGHGAEFTAICQVPDHVGPDILEGELRTLRELTDATISVKAFGLGADNAPGGKITHVLTVGGGDRPGLIARLAEVFASFKVNIVRMDAQTLPGAGHGRYVTRFALSIPASAVKACTATVGNTAGEMGLSCDWADGSH
jgi:glycine cleavage system transcriptional repressor